MPEVLIESGLKEYVATIDFALNWNDKKIKSVKIRAGESVSYDGVKAIYMNPKTQEVIEGPCIGLKTAIEVMKWLIPKQNGKGKVKVETKAQTVKKEDFDSKIGGNFDTFMAKENAAVNTSMKKYNLIQEKDLVVKNLDFSKNVDEEKRQPGRMEVIGDQVAVKEKLIVRNSTTEVKMAKRTMQVISGDEGGSETTIPLKMAKKTVERTKNSFVVDETTPRNIAEDMTLNEVQTIKKVIKADDSQDAKVVGTIKAGPEVQQVEGITFKKTGPRPEKPIKATVSRGGNEPVVSIQDDGKIVGRIKNQKEKVLDADAIAEERKNRAEASKQARIKAAASTQAMLEKEKATVADPEVVPVEKQEIVKNASEKSEAPDYLTQLPDDWGTMHWVQKEKFIKALTDKGFVEFILSVETIKAVQNACTERLKELG
jgi:hypothetical protein